MTRREHIQQLADELGVKLLPGSVSRYGGALDRLSWVVYLPDWNAHEQEVYWVALHELGHAATLGRATPESMLDALLGRAPHGPAHTEGEAQAWAWALDHALPTEWPLNQVAQSNIAWSITDYMHGHGWEPSESFRRIYEALGDEPDWFNDVTTPEHWEKLDGWARPTWAELADHYRKEAA